MILPDFHEKQLACRCVTCFQYVYPGYARCPHCSSLRPQFRRHSDVVSQHLGFCVKTGAETDVQLPSGDYLWAPRLLEGLLVGWLTSTYDFATPSQVVRLRKDAGRTLLEAMSVICLLNNFHVELVQSARELPHASYVELLPPLADAMRRLDQAWAAYLEPAGLPHVNAMPEPPFVSVSMLQQMDLQMLLLDLKHADILPPEMLDRRLANSSIRLSAEQRARASRVIVDPTPECIVALINQARVAWSGAFTAFLKHRGHLLAQRPPLLRLVKGS